MGNPRAPGEGSVPDANGSGRMANSDSVGERIRSRFSGFRFPDPTMNKINILYKRSRRIDPVRTRKLFRRTGFQDWLSQADVAWYLRHALFIASAWLGKRCVGVAVLTGDGRISVSLDLLLVDESFRGLGIGSRLMQLVMNRAKRLDPYHMSVQVFERRMERFYGRFDFVRSRGTWLLEHSPTAERLRRNGTALAQKARQVSTSRAGR